DRHRDRDPAACLLGVEVGGGVAVLDAAHPRDRARDEEERLGEAGLPGPSVTDEHDVPDLRRRIDLQSRFPLATLTHVLERSLGPGSRDPAGREGEKNGGWYREVVADASAKGPHMPDGRWRANVERG